jgi:hypothetical protein
MHAFVVGRARAGLQVARLGNISAIAATAAAAAQMANLKLACVYVYLSAVEFMALMLRFKLAEDMCFCLSGASYGTCASTGHHAPVVSDH